MSENAKEIKRLEGEQQFDDRTHARSEYVGRRVPENRVWAIPLRSGSSRPGVKGFAVEEPGYAEVEDAMTDEPVVLSDAERQALIVQRVISRLNAFEQDVYYLVFGQGLSIRQAAAELRAPSHSRVQRTVDAIKLAVRSALLDEGAGAE